MTDEASERRRILREAVSRFQDEVLLQAAEDGRPTSGLTPETLFDIGDAGMRYGFFDTPYHVARERVIEIARELHPAITEAEIFAIQKNLPIVYDTGRNHG